MDAALLQDRISRGLGVASRRIGASADAYRPQSSSGPLAPRNRFLRLTAAFSAPDGKFARPNTYGSPLWHGVFDSAYTRAGDYLVQGGDTWFIAAQQALLPVLCTKANRTVSFIRPAAPPGIGVNAYGGVSLVAGTALMSGWPASVLSAAAGARPNAELPSDSVAAIWTVLVPAAAGVVLRPSDIMTDDIGRRGVVGSAELSELGWRLLVRQATT